MDAVLIISKYLQMKQDSQYHSAEMSFFFLNRYFLKKRQRS